MPLGTFRLTYGRSIWAQLQVYLRQFVLILGFGTLFGIVLYVDHELRYDHHFTHADATYRIVFDWREESGEYLPDATTPASIPFLARQDIPFIAEATQLMPPWGHEVRVSVDEDVYLEDAVYAVLPNYFRVFDHRFLWGDSRGALVAPDACVITETVARRYFGDSNPIGEILTLDGSPFEVHGVIEEVPVTSHVRPQIFVNLQARWANWGMQNPETKWDNWIYYTYVQLEEGTTGEQLQRALEAMMVEHYPVENVDWSSPPRRIEIQRLTDIHLNSNRRWELGENGDRGQIVLFLAASVLLWVIVSFNHLNLILANTMKTRRERSIRAILGAGRSRLVGRTLLDAGLHVLLASLFAWVLLSALLPWLNGVLGTALNAERLLRFPLFLVVTGAVLFSYLVAVAYPAALVARSRLLAGLRTERGHGWHGLTFRRLLVAAQFTLTTAFIIATTIMMGQIRFMEAKDKGLDPTNVYFAHLHTGDTGALYGKLADELSRETAIKSISGSSGVPGKLNWTTHFQQSSEEGETVLLNFILTDGDILNTLGLNQIVGEPLKPVAPRQAPYPIVLNETAAASTGLGGIEVGDELVTDDGIRHVVTGIVRDFHFRSHHHRIEPFAIIHNPEGVEYIVVKAAEGKEGEARNALDRALTLHMPAAPVEISSLQGEYDQLHRQDRRTASLILASGLFSMLIACTGLFGLTVYAVDRRTREVAVRKVLGAGAGELVVLLNRESILLLFIAALAAIPLAYWAMSKWLAAFAYSITITAGPSLLALLLVSAIAVLTTSSYTALIAFRNPVRYLRQE